MKSLQIWYSKILWFFDSSRLQAINGCKWTIFVPDNSFVSEILMPIFLFVLSFVEINMQRKEKQNPSWKITYCLYLTVSRHEPWLIEENYNKTNFRNTNICTETSISQLVPFKHEDIWKATILFPCGKQAPTTINFWDWSVLLWRINLKFSSHCSL